MAVGRGSSSVAEFFWISYVEFGESIPIESTRGASVVDLSSWFSFSTPTVDAVIGVIVDWSLTVPFVLGANVVDNCKLILSLSFTGSARVVRDKQPKRTTRKIWKNKTSLVTDINCSLIVCCDTYDWLHFAGRLCGNCKLLRVLYRLILDLRRDCEISHASLSSSRIVFVHPLKTGYLGNSIRELLNGV